MRQLFNGLRGLGEPLRDAGFLRSERFEGELVERLVGVDPERPTAVDRAMRSYCFFATKDRPDDGSR